MSNLTISQALKTETFNIGAELGTQFDLKEMTKLPFTELTFKKQDYAFSNVASWASWSADPTNPALEAADPDLTYFADNQIDQLTLNPNVVFLGINAGIGAQGRDYQDYEMFHHNPKTYKNLWLPLVEHGSHLQGGYLTDLFKLLPTSSAADLHKIFKAMAPDDYQKLVDYNITLLKRELALLGPQKKLIIILQSAGPCDQLSDSKALVPSILKAAGFFDDDQYVIRNITHYSAQGLAKGELQTKVSQEIKAINADYSTLML